MTMKAPRTATCRRCRATLTSAASVTAGIGPHCAREERRESMLRDAGFKADQIAAARQAVEDGAVLPLRARRVFLVVSTDGADVHRTTRDACTCHAGLKGRRCFHRAAVILAA